MKLHKTLVHSIRMSDVEDPEIFIAEPIYQWQQTEHGKWVMENTLEQPIYQQTIDYNYFGYTYTIYAFFNERKLMEYYLRYGKHEVL
jgi:hypothetical protein